MILLVDDHTSDHGNANINSNSLDQYTDFFTHTVTMFNMETYIVVFKFSIRVLLVVLLIQES